MAPLGGDVSRDLPSRCPARYRRPLRLLRLFFRQELLLESEDAVSLGVARRFSLAQQGGELAELLLQGVRGAVAVAQTRVELAFGERSGPWEDGTVYCNIRCR